MDALRSLPIARARETCGKIADPGDSRRLILLGQLYAQALAFSDAVGPLQQATKLEPQSFEAWHYLGLSLYGLKQYKEAVAPLRKAAELNPQYFDTLNLLAKTLYSLGDYAGALPVLERAHDLNPADAQLAGVLERLRTALKPKQ
jgi:tetratricopeptide (TPR) repeat protein